MPSQTAVARRPDRSGLAEGGRIVVAGLVGGAVEISLAVSFGALVFRDRLAGEVALGIGLALFSTLVVGLVVAFRGSLPGTVAGSQDATAVVISLAAATLVTEADPTTDTVIAFIAVATAATGVSLLVLGAVRAGALVRYLPFPVIGGFLAGTGFVLIDSTFDLLLDGAGAADLTETAVLGRWLPAVTLAVALVVVTRVWKRTAALPALVVGAAVAYLVALRIAGVSRTEAIERGWLFERVPDGDLLTADAITSLGRADWGAIGGQAASIAVVMLIVPVSLLLYTSAMEHEFAADADGDRELRVTGLGNLVASLGAGFPAYTTVASTVVVHRVVGTARIYAVVVALTSGVALVAGDLLLSVLPVAVIGGLLLYVGTSFILEWLWDSRRRLPPAEYLLMVGIVAAIVILGFLPGVGVGIVVAVVLFVVRYSRTAVVRREMSGSVRRSNVQRSSHDEETLDERGEEVAVLELQGYVFFGTGDRVLAPVRRRAGAEDRPPLRFVVVDFRAVTGFDSSAVASFQKLARLARQHDFTVVLTGLHDITEELIGPVAAAEDGVRLEADLDHGLQWCEDQVLDETGARVTPAQPIAELLRSRLGASAPVDALSRALRSLDVAAGEKLLVQGEPGEAVYLLEEGELVILLEDADPPTRLRTVRAGSVVGEISFYLGTPCTATVQAGTDSRVHRLDHEALTRLAETDPELVSALHLFMVRTLAERLSHSDEVIRALMG